MAAVLPTQYMNAYCTENIRNKYLNNRFLIYRTFNCGKSFVPVLATSDFSTTGLGISVH